MESNFKFDYQRKFTYRFFGAGLSQETSFSKPNDDNIESQLWSLQNLQAGRRRMQPCPKRNNKNDAEEQWTPSYSSRITHPLFGKTILKPLALKNQEFSPEIDQQTETEQHNYQDRRSLGGSNINSTDLKEDDCIDHTESPSDGPLKTTDAENIALKIILDCLKKKQNIKNRTSILEVGASRRSMSIPHTDDSNLFDNYDTNNNYPQDVTPYNLDGLDNNNYDLELNAEDGSRNAGPQNNFEDRNSNQLTTKLIDPVIGTGIAKSQVTENRRKNPRVCYACSTATNPSCWEPNNKTTIKYCTREKSCVTKSFGVKNSLTMIRDCANSCEDSSVPGIEPKYKSCKLCHSDYCNAAVSINTYNLVNIMIISIVKCSF